MQKYRIRQSSEVVDETRLRELFHNSSFSLETEVLDTIGVDVVYTGELPVLAWDEELIFEGIQLVDGKYKEVYSTKKLSAAALHALFMSKKSRSLTTINNDDNKIYADVIGNKATEYLDAANEARAYKTAGYPTTVGEDSYNLVASWAKAKRWTLQQAAEDILAQEADWKGAAKLIRDHRLQAKEDVKRATTVEEVESAMTIWNTFVKNIRTQLGVS